jgi:hypothetical protein
MSKKQKFTDKILLFLAEYLGAGLIWLLGKSLRITCINDPKQRSPENVLYATWHNRMMLFGFSHRNQGINVLISQSKDGELIAKPLRRLGFTISRGSTTRGGIKALFKMARLGVQNKVDLALTPDGPKGPRYKAQVGIILLAKRTGFPIIPAVNIPQKKWQLNSWDGFIIPKPFSKVAIIFGEPIYVSRADNLESKLQELQTKLDEITEEADKYFQASPLNPPKKRAAVRGKIKFAIPAGFYFFGG